MITIREKDVPDTFWNRFKPAGGNPSWDYFQGFIDGAEIKPVARIEDGWGWDFIYPHDGLYLVGNRNSGVVTEIDEDTYQDLLLYARPFVNDRGYVEYQGAAFFHDWSGDLASAPLYAATNEPDWKNESKVADYDVPLPDDVVEEIMRIMP